MTTDRFIQILNATLPGDQDDHLYALTLAGRVFYFDHDADCWRPISMAREPLDAMPMPAPQEPTA